VDSTESHIAAKLIVSRGGKVTSGRHGVSLVSQKNPQTHWSKEDTMLLPLQTGIVYGPVKSRRYGRSLGINVCPADYKLCSLNCVYCHYGHTETLAADVTPFEKDLPAYDDVIGAVEEALQSPMKLDVITFSGNGEPTLHPQFPELVDAVVDLRNRYRPGAKVALLSNSTGLAREDVRRSISRLDIPVFKLDTGTERAFARINRPAKGVRFDEIVCQLKTLRGIYIQTILIDGTPSNTHPDELLAYFELIRDIRPREVHIYSTDRPVADSRISKVDPDWLEDIASQIKEETGVTAVAFYNGKKH
jgi:wyosine [tRNA(Phe)-imidazoG37] synthetase (radical SAM superfamily)